MLFKIQSVIVFFVFQSTYLANAIVRFNLNRTLVKLLKVDLDSSLIEKHFPRSLNINVGTRQIIDPLADIRLHTREDLDEICNVAYFQYYFTVANIIGGSDGYLGPLGNCKDEGVTKNDDEEPRVFVAKKIFNANNFGDTLYRCEKYMHEKKKVALPQLSIGLSHHDPEVPLVFVRTGDSNLMKFYGVVQDAIITLTPSAESAKTFERSTSKERYPIVQPSAIGI